MPATAYKKGQKIYGSNKSFYIKVEQIYSNGDIKISFHTPKGNRKYYSLNGGKWTTIPSSLRITKNGKITLKTEVDDYDIHWETWNWFGNKYEKNRMTYGVPPYAYISYKSKDKPRSQTSSQFIDTTGLGSAYEMIPGTYQWANTVSQGDWSGWYKGNFVRAVRNTYRRPVKAKVRRKKPKITTTSSGTIKITGIRSIPDEPPADITIFDIKNSLKNKIEIPDKPSDYYVNRPVKVYWETDTSKYTYKTSNTTYQTFLGNKKDYSISNNQILTDYGTYNLKVTATGKVSGKSDSSEVSITIADPAPVPKITIFDKEKPSIIYDITNKVFVGPCFPTIKVPDKCVLVSAKLNGKTYTLGDPVVENGLYTITVVVRRTTNNKTATATGIFTIDNTPPDPPIIRIGSESWQGRDFGLVGKYPSPVSPIIQVETGAIAITKVYYRKDLFDTQWVEVPEQSTYTKKGIYRIVSRAKKLSNQLESTNTIIEFYKKIKYRYTITLSPNELCYRTIATVNFPFEDKTMKFLYKIDDGEWKFYRDPVKIYDNCVIYVKSLDGDDDYESYLTSKIVDIIDKEEPKIPEFEGVEEGDIKTSITPTLKK
ncbi:hypothetical protein Bp8pS_023 [Bacillus phage vB_BpuM-BpSp]|nr:hypothetical protein Bp8pS_023 [Bacillus phage vB_BpuM-BpSp]